MADEIDDLITEAKLELRRLDYEGRFPKGQEAREKLIDDLADDYDPSHGDDPSVKDAIWNGLADHLESISDFKRRK